MLFNEKKFRESLPPEMLAEKRFVRYFLKSKPEGGTAKIPLGNHSDPNTWSTFDDVVKAIENDQQGIGYCFFGGDIHGLDIDHCRNPKTGAICNEAMLLLTRIPSWSEYSVSGQGLHVLFKAGVRGKQLTETCLQYWNPKNSPRFFALTCDMVGEAFRQLKDVGDDFNYIFATARHISAKIREELREVDYEQWASLPAEREHTEVVTREKSKTKTRKVVKDFDIKDFLQFYNIGIDNECDNEIGHCIRVTTCPVKGEPHVGQNSTTTNFVYPCIDGGLAFHCQSTGCVDYGIADVIKRLAESKEPYPKSIYETKEDQQYKVTLVSKTYDSIADEALGWLIEDYLPLASEVYLFAPKGRGKTKVCDYFNVLVNNIGKRVLRFNLEDMPSQILKPGLYAAGGNLKLTEWVEPNAKVSKEGQEYPERVDFSQPEHLDALRERITALGNVGLIIIEPINNYKGRAKAISEDDMRPIHTNIAQVALECNVCVLVVSHTNKKKDVDILEKAHGAGSGTHVARVNLFLDKNPHNPDERVLTDAGSNVKVGPSKVFRIVEQPPFTLGGVEHKKVAIAVFDRHEEDITAQGMLEDSEGTTQSMSKNITEFLTEFMGGKGELPKELVVKAAQQYEPTWKPNTIASCFTKGMRDKGYSRTEGGNKNKKTFWALGRMQAEFDK